METSQHFPTGISTIQESVSKSQQLFVTNLFDKAIALSGILFSTDTLNPLFNGVGIPDSALTIVRYSIPLLIGLRLLARWKAVVRVLQSDLLLLAFNIIVFLSFTWSVNPDLTITGLRGEYVQSVLIALFLATRFSMAQQVRLIAVGMGATAVISFLYALLLPNIAIHQDATHLGAWRGIYYHKNYFSAGMVTTLAAFLVQILSPNERRTWHFWMVGLCTTLLLLSTSRTGFVLLLAVLSTIFLYRRYRWRGMKTLLILYLIIVVAAFGMFVLYAAWDQILTGLGRDPTLTGRTLIWEVLRDNFIPQKPFLGYGRGAFWRSGIGAGVFFQQVSFFPTHSHNGWYDLILDVGFVGFFLYALSAIRAWIRSFKLAYISNSAASIWPLAFFTIMHINNYTESYMLTRTNFVWVFYMAICWSLKEALVDEASYQNHNRQVDTEAESFTNPMSRDMSDANKLRLEGPNHQLSMQERKGRL